MDCDEIEIRNLAKDPESFRGRRFAISGWISRAEQGKSSYLVQVEVPVPDGYPEEAKTVVAKYSGDPSPFTFGRPVVLKGECEGIHVLALEGCCGIIVVALVNAASIQAD